jgi:hypothetical protein
LPPYGGSITHNIYYTDSDLCDADNADDIMSEGYPSRDIDPVTGKQVPWPAPFIFMVDRGGCAFAKKVHKYTCHAWAS